MTAIDRICRFATLLTVVLTASNVFSQVSKSGEPAAQGTGPLVRLTSVHKQELEEELRIVAFSPDGDYLAGGGDEFVSILTVDGLRTIHEHPLGNRLTYSLLFSSDSKQLFAGCQSYDADFPSAVLSLQLPKRELEMRESKAVWFKSMTSDGRLCAASEHEIVLHDPKTGIEQPVVSYDTSASVFDQFIKPDGNMVWLVKRSGLEETYWLNQQDVKSQRPQERKLHTKTSKKDWFLGRVYPCTDKIIVCTYSAQEREGSEEREIAVEICDWNDLRFLRRCVIPNVQNFDDGVSLLGGKFFCVVGLEDSNFGTSKGFIAIVDTSTGQIVHRQTVDRRVDGVAFTPKGNLLATVQGWQNDGFQIELWKVEAEDGKNEIDATERKNDQK